MHNHNLNHELIMENYKAIFDRIRGAIRHEYASAVKSFLGYIRYYDKKIEVIEEARKKTEDKDKYAKEQMDEFIKSVKDIEKEGNIPGPVERKLRRGLISYTNLCNFKRNIFLNLPATLKLGSEFIETEVPERYAVPSERELIDEIGVDLPALDRIALYAFSLNESLSESVSKEMKGNGFDIKDELKILTDFLTEDYTDTDIFMLGKSTADTLAKNIKDSKGIWKSLKEIAGEKDTTSFV